MVAAKKPVAVAAVLCLVLGIVLAMMGWNTVSAAEAETPETTVSQTEQSGEKQADSAKKIVYTLSGENRGDTVLTEESLPMAEAEASILETHTEEKGMPSLLGFSLVVAAAILAGIAVALRAKFGKKTRSYVPAEDMTLLKLKK